MAPHSRLFFASRSTDARASMPPAPHGRLIFFAPIISHWGTIGGVVWCTSRGAATKAESDIDYSSPYSFSCGTFCLCCTDCRAKRPTKKVSTRRDGRAVRLTDLDVVLQAPPENLVDPLAENVHSLATTVVAAATLIRPLLVLARPSLALHLELHEQKPGKPHKSGERNSNVVDGGSLLG